MKDVIHILEPELQERRLFTEILSRKYSLRFLKDYDDLLSCEFKENIKVVIYSTGYPDMKVLECLSNMKQDIQGASIILITSANSFGFEKAVRNIGVFYFIIRPFTSSDLIQLIEAGITVWECKNS